MIVGNIDGKRILFGGDNIFLFNPQAGGIEREIAIQTTVMRNSFQLGMHRHCTEVMSRLMPDLICPGHGELIAMDESRVTEYVDYIERKEAAFREIVDEPADHFIDLFWARMLPYVSTVRPNDEVKYTVKIRNNLERTATYSARLFAALQLGNALRGGKCHPSAGRAGRDPAADDGAFRGRIAKERHNCRGFDR